MDWDMVKLQQNISTEYAQAMALYKVISQPLLP